MKLLFWPYLTLIVLFERYVDTPHNRYMHSFFPVEEDTSGDDPSVQNPEPAQEDVRQGLKIAKEQFDDIVKVFPDPNDVSFSCSISSLSVRFGIY